MGSAGRQGAAGMLFGVFCYHHARCWHVLQSTPLHPPWLPLSVFFFLKPTLLTNSESPSRVDREGLGWLFDLKEVETCTTRAWLVFGLAWQTTQTAPNFLAGNNKNLKIGPQTRNRVRPLRIPGASGYKVNQTSVVPHLLQSEPHISLQGAHFRN